MKILITGGAGFVGSNLAVDLSACGHVVTAFDNLSRRGSELNLPRLKDNFVEFVHGDVRNSEDLKHLGADIIIDCAAEPSVMMNGMKAINSNLNGTLNCLELARQYDADFVFMSTNRVYPTKFFNELCKIEYPTRFDVDMEGIDENTPMSGARTIYGATKLAGELLVQEYADSYGMNAVINRCGVIAGPWQFGKTDQGIIAHWLMSHVFSKPLKYIGYGGRGKQVRDILHVDDLSALVNLQVDDIKKYDGDVFNVGGGRMNSISLLELTKKCQEITGNVVEILSVEDNRKGDIPWYITDNSKVKKATGWEPKKSIDEILNDTYLWIMRHKKQLEKL